MNGQKGEEIAAGIIADYKRLAGKRGTIESHWNEIATRIVPSHSNTFSSPDSAFNNQGQKKTEQLYDATAAMALNRFAAILDSLLTPRAQKWHRLKASDPTLNKNRSVILYFEEVTRLLFKYRYAPKANFASQNNKVFKSLGAYGSSGMYIDRLRLPTEKGVRYRNIHLGEIYFIENHQGIVDGAIRYFPLEARQAHQKWGDKLPKRIIEALKINPQQQFFFIHCVKPNPNFNPEVLDVAGMQYSEHYVSLEGQTLLETGGYRVFPFAISRYEQNDNEVYGRSPAMDILPAVKTLNEEKKTVLTQGQRAVSPVLLAHDDGVLDTFSMKPGFVNFGGVNADGRPLVHALPVGNIAIGKDLMDDERATINDAFLVTLFQILTETPQMTATETLERAKEKGILLAPTVGRQESEYLGPMIEREISVLNEQGLLPAMPRILQEAEGEYTVEYDSPLSRAQRAEEASGLMRTVEHALQIVNVTQNPEPLDHFDWDVIIPEVADIQGVPARWMKDPELIAAMRDQRAAQAQEQNEINAAPAAAAMVKAVATAKKAR